MIRATQNDQPPTVIEVFEMTDPVECEKACLQRAQFDRNSAWLQAHIKEVYAPENRGKVVAIAGEEAFFGDTGKDAVEQALTAHPDDEGYFTRYIPRKKMVWMYTNRPALEQAQPAFLHGFSTRDGGMRPKSRLRILSFNSMVQKRHP
jgi:hypothetical protein